MRIAYLTLDDVNQELALELAARWGIRMDVLSPRDSFPEGALDLVLYDLDHWPEPERQQALSRLLDGPAPHPTAVHSYNLDERQVKALRGRGVAVYRRLGAAVFKQARRTPGRGATAAADSRQSPGDNKCQEPIPRLVPETFP
jgi:hypothetical protein